VLLKRANAWVSYHGICAGWAVGLYTKLGFGDDPEGNDYLLRSLVTADCLTVYCSLLIDR
jgi:hypothetical protein